MLLHPVINLVKNASILMMPVATVITFYQLVQRNNKQQQNEK